MQRFEFTSYRALSEETFSLKENELTELRLYKKAWYFLLEFFGFISLVLLAVVTALIWSKCCPSSKNQKKEVEAKNIPLTDFDSQPTKPIHLENIVANKTLTDDNSEYSGRNSKLNKLAE